MSAELRAVDPLGDASQKTAEYLRGLADKAARGEIRSVVCVIDWADGRYSTGGSSTMNRLQMMGALFEAMLERARAD